MPAVIRLTRGASERKRRSRRPFTPSKDIGEAAASCFIAIANYLHKKADFRPFGGCFLKGIGVRASPVFGRLGGNGPCPRRPRAALPVLPDGGAARPGSQAERIVRSRQ